MVYCKKCGRILIYNHEKCDVCSSPMYKAPEKYEKEIVLSKNQEDQFYEELVKPSPEFDEELFNARPQILAKKDKEHNQYKAICNDLNKGYDMRTALKHVKDAEEGRSSKPEVECPYCHSCNTTKISGASRWLSVGLFGIGSKKVGKQWHCKSCGSDF